MSLKNKVPFFKFASNSAKFLFVLFITFIPAHSNAEKPQNIQNNTTVVLLIDGFSWDQYELMMEAKKIPQIRYFFGPLKSRNSHQGKSAFPSLTFNNITAVLTGQDMETNPIKGNKNIFEDNIINFESPVTSDLLKKIVQPQSLFKFANSSAFENWSFSYSFQLSPNLGVKPNIKTGFQYLSENYRSIDKEIIELALEKFKKSKKWPSFVFIHLIGVDALNHENGPSSPESLKYIQDLDSELKPLLTLLSQKEKQYKVGTLLLADHGFSKITKKYPLAKFITENLPSEKSKPLVVDESRFLGIYFPNSWSEKDRKSLLEASSPNSAVMGWALRYNDHIEIKLLDNSMQFEIVSSNKCNELKYHLVQSHFLNQKLSQKTEVCVDALDLKTKFKNLITPYENIVNYFANTKGPNALIFANDGFSFQDKYLGDHGGMTEQEMLTPFLTRNISISSKESFPIPTYKVLKTLKLR